MNPFVPSQSVLNIAHRGGAGERPESTLEAFRHALSVGADVLELDVHLSRDGRLVVSHDPDLRRIAGEGRLISEMTLPDIRTTDAGALWSPDGTTTPYAGKGLTLPTLAELFEALPEAQFNVDIKVEDPRATEEVARLIRDFDRVDHTVVASFISKQLRRLRRTAPEIVTSAHPGDVRRFLLFSRLGLPRLVGGKVPYLQVPEHHGSLQLVTPATVEAAHRSGREVHVWTVNERNDMIRLIALGVDGIVTDYPSRLSSLLREGEKGTNP